MAAALLACCVLLLAWCAGAGGAGGAGGEGCPPRCACGEGGARVQCRGAGLQQVPPLPDHVRFLDVSHNNISWLPALLAPALQDLNLSRNPLLAWPAAAEGGAGGAGGAGGGAALTRLWLDACALRELPLPAAPARLPALRLLSAEDNLLSELGEGALAGAAGLRALRLARNLLRAPPAAALAPLRSLQTLDLGGNLIAELGARALPALPALHTLILKRNRLVHVDARAFELVPALRVLRLEENQLLEVPAALALLPALEDLSVSSNQVERVGGVGGGAGGGALRLGRLARLDLAHNPLGALHRHDLDHLPRLNTLILSGARALRELPALNASVRLHTLRADRARLAAAPAAPCARAPRLRTLDLHANQLESLPDLERCADLRVLDLSWNHIGQLSGSALRGAARLLDLRLAHNRIRRLHRAALHHVPRLRTLDLEDNGLEHIDAEAFLPVPELEELNVGDNSLAWLPGAGLRRLRVLRAHNNAPLRRFLPPAMLPSVQTLVLSYAYHCCEFLSLMEDEGGGGEGEEEEGGGLSDFVLVPAQHMDAAAWANVTDLYAHYLNLTGAGESRLVAGAAAAPAARRRVQCAPAPGPFLPCVDLFEWWTLRCGVWAVFLLALLGNGTVVFVLACSRGRLDVPRFLVANLAAADFCMGLYLGFLAVVDAGTLGEFRAHAVAWQLSGGCRLAGFLGVLSSELSVYTLAVITLERNYAITHAMHLNKRLSLRHAAGVMGAGWALAVLAAALPLAGVSDYRKFAVCLPFETSTPGALAYVTLLLAVNGLAFLVLLGCYLKMYCAIRGSQAWNSNDSRIARRMALLVFTDFLCWAPVAVSALSAAWGARLVSLEHAKVFTVFVLPLNSCCNPFLYAILTKQFKKDCALVCKAIEESRVTRGIGRCRHSSNFSNRQTPANTNSLAERSSRGHAPACACRRLLPPPAEHELRPPRRARPRPAPHAERLLRWLRACAAPPAPPRAPPAPAPARAGSVSSSVEFSSSRSDSWRRPPPPPRRAASWLVARKTSQDSNLSSSRNDSSGSNATASTGTWRTSRSAGSAAGGAGAGGAGARPRLTRQPAVLGDEPPLSPPAPAAAAGARLLHTIPSAAEPEPPPDDAPPPAAAPAPATAPAPAPAQD